MACFVNKDINQRHGLLLTGRADFSHRKRMPGVSQYARYTVVDNESHFVTLTSSFLTFHFNISCYDIRRIDSASVVAAQNAVTHNDLMKGFVVSLSATPFGLTGNNNAYTV